jgi:hemerythrin
MTIEIVNFLKDWLQKHIMGVDRKYMECFSRNGLH